MLSCQYLWFLFFPVVLLHRTEAKPFNSSAAHTRLPPLDLIVPDVIHDKVEMDTKKIIRVNPLDLPPLKDNMGASAVDSSLYKIQTLKPLNGPRNYLNLNRSSKPSNKVQVDTNYSGFSMSRAYALLPSPDKTSKVKHQAKRKNLHFLYNQTDLAGNNLSKTLPVHMTPGAYPVYYMIAKTNGRFGKYPLKSFGSVQDFRKYLQKNKIGNISNHKYSEI